MFAQGSQSTFGEWYINAHPLLPVSQDHLDVTEVVLLGHAIDPRQPGSSNVDIARALARCKGFDALEQSLARLSGRWAAFASVASEWRLYPDANGSKSIFYDSAQVASHPMYMGHGPDDSMSRFPGQTSTWPMDRTPYPGVRQLLPNHYLDLQSMRSVRFGPRPVSPVSLSDAVVRIRELLRGTIEAVIKRGSVALPLTGGLDTRSLLSAATGLPIKFFTVINQDTPLHDLAIPPEIARRLGLDWHFVDGRTADFPAESVMGGIWRDPNSSSIGSFKQADFIVWGHGSGTIRCQYGVDGRQGKVTAESLSRIAGFANAEWAVPIFAEWLATVPDWVDALDLFYWEYRAGVWTSLTGTAFDYLCDVIAPFNCREVIELGLGVDCAYRCKSPPALFTELCLPELRGLPVNSTAWERLEGRLPAWFPWRLRQAIGNALRERVLRLNSPLMRAPTVTGIQTDDWMALQ